MLNLPAIHFNISFPGKTIIRNYVPDIIWCMALNLLLFALHFPSLKIAKLISFFTFSLGCVWESLQFFTIIPGFGDVIDCLAYGVGSFLALCIYYSIKGDNL